MRAQSILLKPRESEIVDAVFQSEKCIRGESVESCKLRYLNSFEFLTIRGFGVTTLGRIWVTPEALGFETPTSRLRTSVASTH